MNIEDLTIRKARDEDIPEILRLLSQVLEIHVGARPDIFVHGTTKYSDGELREIIADEKTPVYAAFSGGKLAGYCFCEIREMPEREYFRPFRYVYIDDLCVDEAMRSKHVGSALFEYVKNEAKALGAYEITLHVWEGNDKAKAFYDKLGFTPQSYTMEYKLD